MPCSDTGRPISCSTSRVVRVAVPRPLPRLFDYLADGGPVPVPGARVRVPFGRQSVTAICVAVDPADPHDDPKPLQAVLDQVNVFGNELYGLAHWLADYYHHPLGEVLAAMLPVPARRGAPFELPHETLWRLTGIRPDLRRAPLQRALLAHLEACGGCARPAQLEAAGFSAAVIRGLAAKGVLRRDRLAIGAEAAERHCEAALPLSDEQQAVLDRLCSATDRFEPSLLEGVTGSGKTEVYLQLIDRVRRAGRQVLVLVPEIALTPQTLRRFERRFGTAAALHSNLTDAQRLEVWLRCRSGETGILIGTRSAVLTPFRDLGLIVVDEEHDGSFKQQDGLRYSARDVAVKRAQTLGIPLLLGSATPSLESLVNASGGRYRHLHLRERAGGARMPAFHLLDIRGHTLQDGISDRLRRIMAAHLRDGGQALVFLNRRGYSPAWLCTSCGWRAECRHCEMPMTLHRRPEALICHHCGLRETVTPACPACGRADLLAVGLGTQRTEAGLEAMFPGTPLYRIDRDTTRSHRRLQAQLEAIRSGRPAILVGTQMLAKGHHFPNVTLVAVVNADAGFLSADFRAPERTAQLIIQVAGRAGRAERAGEVWIQTHQPENVMLQSLVTEGYPGFARRELEVRQSAGLPPFRPMILIRAEGADRDETEAWLGELRDVLARRAAAEGGGVELLGPAAAPISKVASRYRCQLMVLADTRGPLHRVVRTITADPPRRPRVRWTVDVDPYDTF
jgi:primosomal protein N' (replication factor Y) (superfamily II helicase)